MCRRKGITAIGGGAYFFDYGNSFLKAIYDAGVKDISRNGIDEKDGFIWPSYVEDIMGPELFDYGYGPFRWVCLSGKKEDLVKTDHAAMDCIDPDRRGQDRDNYNWIRDREKEIIQMFFGIGQQEMTLEEIGDKFGLTRERVRQIKEKAIRRLRQSNRSKLLKSYLG